MKNDKSEYIDREENPIGMTAYQTSRPDKVLYFADPHCTHGKSHKPKLVKEYNFT